jgi:hypothetical protein
LDGSVRLSLNGEAIEAIDREVRSAICASLAPEREMTRVAVVTPYYKEPLSMLRRNLDSVKCQTHSCDHIVVADGNPQEWLDDIGVIHIRLPQNSNDCGDSPRCVGIAYACSRDYDAIALLDADCYLLPHAVEMLLAVAATHKVPLVVGKRLFVRPDGTTLNAPEEPTDKHIDTNCYFFLRAGFGVLLKWSLIPPMFHPIDDRILRIAVRVAQLPYAVAPDTTVVFETRYWGHYKLAGEEPPPGCKTVDVDEMTYRWTTLEPSKREAYCAALGFQIY